ARKFFILNGELLTFHADQGHSLAVQGVYKLEPDTEVDTKPNNLVVARGPESGELVLLAENPAEAEHWKVALRSSVVELKGRLAKGEVEEADAVAAAEQRQMMLPRHVVPKGEKVLKRGYLCTRPSFGGDVWVPNYYVLTTANMHRYADDHHVEAMQSYRITPSCSVFETNLKVTSFELVTASKVLHLQGATYEV
ncbi:unnamed protein product, partial [Chrysoparadoxa australica]